MINQWGNESYNMMPNLMGPPGPLLPTPIPSAPGMVPPLAPPAFIMNDWGTGNPDCPGGGGPGPGPGNFIGPVIPTKPDVDLTNEEVGNENVNEQQSKKRENKDSRDNRRDMGDRDRNDRGRRQRSPYNKNRDRNDRSRSERRERRPPRWSDNKDIVQTPVLPMGNNMMIPGHNLMPYASIMTPQPMDMGNMQHLQNMNNMQNMGNMMPGMNMMPNMMSNMMDPNMLMMQQQMAINMNNVNMPIYVANGVLLPPLPNYTVPKRRDRPPGCRTIFVGGLPHGIGEDVIREIFERFGYISDIKLPKQGICHVRFGKEELVEQTFFISGFRYKTHDQMDNEATTLFIDYALNRDDQNEYERYNRKRDPTPPRIEPYTSASFTAIIDKIKSDNEFAEAAPTLAGWLERGECNKRNANSFYSLIQASNNQIRRLYNEKMAIDEDFQAVKAKLKDKFANIIHQFEQVGKILTAAKIQRNSDHFSKQQRRNIEMWLKMTEDVENIKEEFNSMFDEEEVDDKAGKSNVLTKKYEELKVEFENLQYELDGYRNEAHLAKDEAERKFEKFKAHFIAQQALQNKQSGQHQVFPPLPPLPQEPPASSIQLPASNDDNKAHLPSVAPSEAKLISVLSAFLLVHPLGAPHDYLVSYVRSIVPNTNQTAVSNVLHKYGDVFTRSTDANNETKWTFVTFDIVKKEMA